MDERENMMALAMIALLVAIGSGFFALKSLQEEETPRKIVGFGAVAILAAGGTIVLWLMRPGLEEIDRRVAAAMSEGETGGDSDSAPVNEGTLICTLASERSRIVSARADDVEFTWESDGCVNSRTQYGLASGDWRRVFVPNDEDAVSVNTYDPETRTFRTDRFLLGQDDMAKAREARSRYKPPQCGVTDASRILGEQQSGVLSLLPTQPNERLVYECKGKAE